MGLQRPATGGSNTAIGDGETKPLGGPLWLLAGFCAVSGICAWVFYLWAFHRDPGQDWMVFYTAARAYFDGNLPLIFDGEQLTAALNARFADWLGLTLNLHPWVYPPTFLLLFLPFAALPAVASFAVFQLAGFTAAIAAVRGWATGVAARRLMVVSLVLCPAVPFNVMTGQNGFYSLALLLGGFGLLGRAPLFGGALLGILTFKPQLWLMVPVALLAMRQWRALFAAGAAALLVALASVPVFGVEIWRQWIALMTGGSQFQEWLAAGRINGLSVFACARLLGAPQFVASLCQDTAVIIAAGCVYWIFRRRDPGALGLAALLAATLLAAPHASASDALLLGPAACLFFIMTREGRFPLGAAMLAAAVWLCPLVNPPSVFRLGLLTPLLLAAFLACIICRLREKTTQAAGRGLLPAQQASLRGV